MGTSTSTSASDVTSAPAATTAAASTPSRSASNTGLDTSTSDNPFLTAPSAARSRPATMALEEYYHNKIESMKLEILKGQAALRRLEAQRNDYNSRVRLLREELGLLQQPGSYVGEVVKVMSTKKILVKVHPEGKYAVDVGKLTPGKRVTLLSDSYKLEKLLPSSVDPLVSLMMVEKVPDSTYDMIGGLDQQIKEIKEVIEL